MKLADGYASLMHTALRNPTYARQEAVEAALQLNLITGVNETLPTLHDLQEGLGEIEGVEIDNATGAIARAMAWDAFDLGRSEAQRRLGSLTSAIKRKLPRWARWLPVGMIVQLAAGEILDELESVLERELGRRDDPSA